MVENYSKTLCFNKSQNDLTKELTITKKNYPFQMKSNEF